MKKLTFESSIAMPDRKFPGVKGGSMLKEMNIGDSYFDAKYSPTRISTAKKNLGYKFSTRTVTENGVTGIRVWRTA